MKENKTKNNSVKGSVERISKTSAERQFTLERGWVYWFDPSKETKVGTSPLLVILSNTLHNKLSDHIIVALASCKNVEPTDNSFEVYCEVEGRKLKVLVSEIHTIQKDKFFGRATYLGRVGKEYREEIGEKLKLILQL